MNTFHFTLEMSCVSGRELYGSNCTVIFFVVDANNPVIMNNNR
jgi:hypothetical protein